MNAQRAKLKRVAIFLAATSTALIPAITHADWSIMELGNLGGGTSHAYDINDSGQVVGWSDTASGDASAFITGPNGIGIINLGSLGGDIRDHSGAYGINDSGQVVGDSRSADRSGIHAFIAGPNGVGMTDLGTLGGNFSHAYDINDSGQVVGKSSITGFGHPFHAFITGPNGVGMTDLGTLGEGYSYAYGINDSGQVVGSSNHHGFITGPNGVGMEEIGTLGGYASGASGINDSGQVVGTSYLAGDEFTAAFVTGSNGIGMTNLGTLGGSGSLANAINDAGEVVGVAATAAGEGHAFIFSHGGMTDLSVLTPVVAAGWTDIEPVSINNNGQIVGVGHHHGDYEAFLLSYTPDTVFTPSPIFIPPPIPEPEPYLMLLGGLGLIGYLARRRKEMAI